MKFSFAFLAVLAVLALSIPAPARAADDKPPPPLVTAPAVSPAPARAAPEVEDVHGERTPAGFHWEIRQKKGLFASGMVLLGIGYSLSVLYSVAVITGSGSYGTDASTYVLLVPVGGPVISQIMFSSCSRCGGSLFGNSDPFRVMLTVVTSALQIPGLAMLIRGMGTTREMVSNEELARHKRGRVQWAIAPGAPGAPLGVSLLLSN